MVRKTARQSPRISGISREEAEVYCLLRVIKEGSSSMSEIAQGLGLSLAHTGVIAQICESLADKGEMEMTDDKASLTRAGRETLATIAAKAGIKSTKPRARRVKTPKGRARTKSKRKTK